jgi:undecaprenyl-diphosphatase
MIKYALLGIVQGLTEFLPVSSSGHLVVMQKMFGMEANQIVTSVVLHLGTLLAVVIFFRKDIAGLRNDPGMLKMIFITVLITGAIAIAAKDFFEGLFSSARAVGIAWLFTGSVLVFTARIRHRDRGKIGSRDSIIMGLAQSLAVIPGVSRSGITISALLYRGIERRLAFVFSFLVSIPLILGAAFLEAKKLEAVPPGDLNNLGAGFACSVLSGLFSLAILNRAIAREKFHYFGYYCFLMGILTLTFIK